MEQTEHGGGEGSAIVERRDDPTPRWRMATAVAARTRFGSLKVTAQCELGLPFREGR